jgi:RNA polymerase sigma factor (sigma-70 family)
MTLNDYNLCVDKYADNLYRFILKNMRDEDEAKDVVQDAFEKMWIRHKEIQTEKAKSYMFTTAYHTMIDRLRRSKRISSLEESETIEPSHNSQYNDVKEIVNKAVARLPEIQRSVVMLRDYEGYSYEEIGEITGLNESQVKVYIYRARLALKEYLGSIERVL